MSGGSTLSEIRDSLSTLPAYAAHDDFPSYAHWERLDGRDSANQLVDQDGNLASIVVIGQVMQGRLSVAPLGNYQAQEDKRNYDSQSQNKVNCKEARMHIYLRRPTLYPDWIADYDMATKRLDNFQEAVATSRAPRQWFLEQTQKIEKGDKIEKIFIIKFNHILWQKKQISGEGALNNEDDDDNEIRHIREEEREKAKETSTYADFVSARFKDEFNIVSNDHHIRPPSVFLINGKRVNPALLEARLPDALVEIVFTLRHYHIGGWKSGNYNKGRSQTESHTFTAFIEHVKILQSGTSKPSMLSTIQMKVLPRSPVKGKEVLKRVDPDHPGDEDSSPKKRRIDDAESPIPSTSHSVSDSSLTESSVD